MNRSIKLREYFPMIKTKDELLEEIQGTVKLRDIYDSWTDDEQKRFVDICTGAKGVKITYDPYFKEIFNPEYDSTRLNNLLSCILGRSVKVIAVLPNDGTRLSDENTLLITDIVVELEDGSLANVEIQKIGYLFPCQRAACYSADLLLRQYKRVRDKRKKKFKYNDIKNVYTIIIFEKSPSIFYNSSMDYIHYAEAQTDTGITLDLLQKYVFINLDIFLKSQHNKPISNDTEAWLTFLSSDDTDDIIRLIEEHPEFKPLYQDIYEMCQNVEDIMSLFSKELQILDANTVQFMVDEMQKEIDKQKDELDKQKNELDKQKNELDKQKNELDKQKNELNAKDLQIEELQVRISELEKSSTS